MKPLVRLVGMAALAAVGLHVALSQEIAPREKSPRRHVGLQADGSVVLPNGWTITHAGKQIPLSTLPMSMAVTPDEKHMLVLNGGFLPPSVSVINLAGERETARVPVEDGWLGLAVSPNGEKVYVGGGSTASVFEFDFRDGKLVAGRTFPVVPPRKRRPSDHIGDVTLSADGRFLYAANLFRNSVTVMNASTGFLTGEFKTGRRPYRLLPNLDGETLLVSHWAESTVGLYRISDGQLIERIGVGPHPTDMLLRPGAIETPEGQPPIVARLFVACANTNSVTVLGVSKGNRFRLLEHIPVAPTPRAPLGSTPTALGLSADGKLLYAVASGNNTIVVSDVSGPRAELLGAIPTGWYPTAVRGLRDGRLLYLNGKGNGSHAAPLGPDPNRRGEEQQYVASLETGSLGILPPLSARLYQRLTQRVIANTPYSDELLANAFPENAGIPAGNPVPARLGEESPIRHVIYVLKENRTFDQVLGGLEGAKADRGLVVFGDGVTPNHHKIAREFVLLDNFYATGSVSADGQSWSAGAMAGDYVEKMWPSYYGRRRQVYDFEGGEPTAVPPAGYLWTNALGRGLTVRNYGMWTARGSDGAAAVLDPALAPHTNPEFAPFDLDVPDQERVDVFLQDFERLEAAGALPRLMMVRLPGDHTAGREPGKRTARAMMAEHDLALGKLVEAVSRSKPWSRTALFIIEDDAQDGADHVDSHRSLAFIVSPYVKRGAIDSTLYTTASVLRTIGLILGLRPMSQFDAAATPMANAFTAKPDPKPYEAVEPRVDLQELNPAGAGGRSRRVENRFPLFFSRP